MTRIVESTESATRELSVYVAIVYCIAIIPALLVKTESTENDEIEPINSKNLGKATII